MSGRLPKPEETRQRTNRASSRTTLAPVSRQIVEGHKPRLPKCPNDGKWHGMSKRWWDDVWSSPMSYEFLQGDVPALFRLVTMVDMFWKRPTVAMSAEIRLLEREFGLTPLSRRRLEWSVVQTEDAKDKSDRRRTRQATTIDADYDPRGALDA